MQTLRHKQKEFRRKRVISVAMTLFLKRGYNAVKLEEIAREAEVSAATTYTYFKTKNDLLLAVIIEDFQDSFEMGEKIISGTLTDTGNAVTRLAYCHFREVEGGPSREMWRIAIAAYIRNPDSPFSKEYDACLKKMRRQYVQLIGRLRTLGHLPISTDVSNLTNVLINNANMIFIEFTRDETVTIASFFKRLNATTDKVILWAKGN